MARYIDAENLITFKFPDITNVRYNDGRRKSEEEIFAYKVGYNTAIEDAQFAPSIDVVRCFECKHKAEGQGYCYKHGIWLHRMRFCSVGERRDDE